MSNHALYQFNLKLQGGKLTYLKIGGIDSFLFFLTENKRKKRDLEIERDREKERWKYIM